MKTLVTNEDLERARKRVADAERADDAARARATATSIMTDEEWLVARQAVLDASSELRKARQLLKNLEYFAKRK